MSLGQHLLELRKRLFISAVAIIVVAIGGFIASDWILAALRTPILEIAGQGRDASLNYTDITGAFDLKLQIAFTVGIIVASPVWLYEIWAFLVPGLTRKEIRFGLGFCLTAIPLFFAGCVAGWFVMPHIVELMTGFAPAEDAAIITAKVYYDFVLKLMIAVGIGFTLPVFLVLLNFAGVLSAASIIKSWRIAVLAIALFTAIATPAADVFSMFLLAIPMVGLYLTGAGIAWVHDRRVAKRQLAFEQGLAV